MESCSRGFEGGAGWRLRPGAGEWDPLAAEEGNLRPSRGGQETPGEAWRPGAGRELEPLADRHRPGWGWGRAQGPGHSDVLACKGTFSACAAEHEIKCAFARETLGRKSRCTLAC